MISRKFAILIGLLLMLLSTLFATQYATTKVAYDYSIVHPSDADIRFIGSDNSSEDGIRLLRVANNVSTSQYVQVNLGNWMPNSMKNYTAAFAIVNEEQFPINISFVNVSGTTASYMSVWLHGNRSKDAGLEETASRIRVVNAGASVFNAGACAWQLGEGNGQPYNMNTSGDSIANYWDTDADVRWSNTNYYAKNGTQDYVWVQISINIPSSTALAESTGLIFFHFEAVTTPVEGGGGPQNHIYIVDDSDAQAYEGDASDGGFNDGSENEFTAGEYVTISVNDSNSVSDFADTENNYQYHRFVYTIEESVDSITQVKILWKGSGSTGMFDGHSLWVKESGAWTQKNVGWDIGPEILSVTYTSDFSDIIVGGVLQTGAQCEFNYDPPPPPTQTSGLYSCYAEITITYTE